MYLKSTVTRQGRGDVGTSLLLLGRIFDLDFYDDVCDAGLFIATTSSFVAVECRRCGPFMDSVGAFEWQVK